MPRYNILSTSEDSDWEPLPASKRTRSRTQLQHRRNNLDLDETSGSSSTDDESGPELNIGQIEPADPTECLPQDTSATLDADILLALGEKPKDKSKVGEDIHPELASRWVTYAQTGARRQDREHLAEKYPVPANGILLQGPTLNEEIEAALDAKLGKQDKFLRKLQSTLKKRSFPPWQTRPRDFAKFVGKLIAACPAVNYGWAHVKLFEREKYLALKANNGNYEHTMTFSPQLEPEFKWWLSHVLHSKNSIKSKVYEKEIFSDASTTGWGAYCDNKKAHGFWSMGEVKLHINTLELIAAYKALNNCDILLRIDMFPGLPTRTLFQ
ncbi:hypothetical protein NQ315_017434 [Exocentrus adspersus]|uniref:Transposase n=1 Tax=Exocentrus adspersus TaxID=1586481 RepID=A0AAV8VKT5_9CUCU|nr:hypothetical protein NQ315_017434 [Exocentrus adspersus]